MEEDEYGKAVRFVRAPFSFVHLGEVKASRVFSNEKRSVFFMSEPNANAIPSTRAANRSRTHKLTISAMLSGVAFLSLIHI